MSKELNIELKKEIPLKFHLNQHLLDSHFNKESVLYEISVYVIQKIKENKDKELSYGNMKFSPKTLKYIFGKEFLEEHKDKVVGSIKELQNKEFLELNGKTFYIKEKAIKVFYNIKK